LIPNSTLVDRTTGRSAGFAPLRMHGGAGSRGTLGVRNGHTTAPFADECQSFLDNVIACLRQPGACNDQPRPLAAFLRGFVADRKKVERLFTQRAENGMSDARAKALRECNAEAGK